MDFVDVLVCWSPVQGAVVPVVPGVLDDEEDEDLVEDLPPGWEGNGDGHAHEVRHGMEEPYLWKFDGEVADEDEFRAVPLFFCGRYFLLLLHQYCVLSTPFIVCGVYSHSESCTYSSQVSDR